MTARACLSCLSDVTDGDYHHRCARALFGTPVVPRIDVELAKLHTLALAMVGHTSISGVQRKISVGMSADRATLQLAVEGGRFILKPQSSAFPHLPENEHVTMRLGALAGLVIPPCGLIALRDGSLAYLVRRFDRLMPAGKLAQEDFCQLAQLSPKQKYEGSAELCARIVRRFASEPGVELLKLFRLVVFSWWTGNGDMHLKNFSLLRGGDGMIRLSPAYDLLCTRLVIPDDLLALPIGGNRGDIRPREWLDYARACGLPPRAGARAMEQPKSVLEPAVALLARSALPPDLRGAYEELLRARAANLGAAAQHARMATRS